MLSESPFTGQCDILTITPKITIPMVWCPPGQFVMGTPDSYAQYFQLNWARPLSGEAAHPVTLTHGFWISRSVITQEIWEELMKENTGFYFKGDNLPVICNKWRRAVMFCKVLENVMLELNNAKKTPHVTLPTSAQWEYACRAGTQTLWYFGDDVALLDRHAWYEGNGGKIHPVEQKQANPWGLFDLYGNVEEWCLDGLYRYPLKLETDPIGPVEFTKPNDNRVLRGGGCHQSARQCRSSHRSILDIDNSYDLEVGLRIVIDNIRN